MGIRMMLRKRIQCSRRSQTFFAKSEDGAALMIVLIVLVGLTVLATAGTMLTTTAIRTSENTEAGMFAFYAADGGLAEYLGTSSNDGTDTVTYTYAQGTATVWGEKLLNVTTDSSRVLYRIISQGTHGSPSTGQTNRTVSVVAILSPGENPFNFTAAFTAATGVTKQGGSGIISGLDASDSTACEAPDVAGTTVPQIPGYTQTNGDTVPVGIPNISVATDPLTILNEMGIDWSEMLAGNVISPDYHIPPDAYPFTENDALDPEGWPVIIVDQDYMELGTWKQSGRGLLIIRGDFESSGNFVWDGVVLVGGQIRTNGSQEYHGAIVAGLNLLLGETAPETEIGNGNITIQYNNCNIERAFSGMGGLFEEPGTWSESM